MTGAGSPSKLGLNLQTKKDQLLCAPQIAIGMKPNKSEMFNRSRRDGGPAFDNKSLNIHDIRSR